MVELEALWWVAWLLFSLMLGVAVVFVVTVVALVIERWKSNESDPGQS